MNRFKVPPAESLPKMKEGFAEYSLALEASEFSEKAKAEESQEAPELSEGAKAEESHNLVTTATLYAYASGNLPFPQPWLEKELKNSPGKLKAFRHLAKSLAHGRPGMAKAASDDDLLPRSGDGFQIRFEAARSHKGNYYLIIDLKDPRPQLKFHMFLWDPNNRSQFIELRTAQRGIIQHLIKKDNPALELFRNPRTEVYLFAQTQSEP